MKRVLIIALVFFLLAGCGRGDMYGYDFNPVYQEIQSIDDFFLEFFNKELLSDPETATWMGTYEGSEANRKDHKLTDISYRFQEKKLLFYKNSLEVMQSFADTELSYEEQINREVLTWYLSTEIQGEAYIYHNYLINHFDGIPGSLPSSLIGDHQVNLAEDAENYIKRLEAFPWKFGLLADGINKQVELGMVPPDNIIRAFNTSIAQFTAPEPRDNCLYTTFVIKLDECPGLTEGERAQFKAEALQAIENHVYPAYQQLLQETLLPIIRNLDRSSLTSGVWELPQGDEYYAYLVRKFTTTDLTPQEVHDMGLREVERIQKEIRRVLDDMGYQNQDTIKTLQRVKNAEMLRDRDEIIDAYRQAVQEAQAILPEFFNTLPQGEVLVEPVPSHREETFTNHYIWPSRDGQRLGTFFVNLSYPHSVSDIKALAFHETVPGHHLQFAIQIEAALPLFRDIIWTDAYSEGWALYAEKLMYENGCYGDPLSELGYLQSELFRAARLVIDTGIHYKRWSRREALNYLEETTGLSWGNEIDRYTVWPGQALSYKVGELKILELRQRAQEELGAEFDLREFHDVALRRGSIPLELLEKEVLRYIEQKKN